MSIYTYVETTPPETRKPPLTETGALGWVRKNLISTWYNALLTVGAVIVIVYVGVGLLTWVVGAARWEVVVDNLRAFGSGRYPPDQIDRVTVVALIVAALAGLSWGLWGRLARATAAVWVIALAFLVVAPVVGRQFPRPPIFALVSAAATEPVSPLAFVGDAGQTLQLTLTPAMPGDATPKGYIDMASRAAWGEFSRSTLAEGEGYDLTATVRLLGSALEGPAALQVQAGGAPAVVEVALPATTWYTLDLEAQGAAGAAWLTVEGVSVMSASSGAQEANRRTYGPPPDQIDGKRIRPLDNTQTRFVGVRNLGDFLALVVGPFAEEADEFALVVSAIVFAGYAAGLALRRRNEKVGRRLALLAWVISFPATLVILRGFEHSTSLPFVGTDRWGGLLLTLILATVGIIAAFPIGVLAALGRRSSLPVVRVISTVYIEFVRGVPLVTVIWAANVMVPLAEPRLANVDSMVRAMVGMTLFTGAYLAENVRGGLQSIPRGQEEAARALGMNTLLVTALITLPQALRAVIPAIAGLFISLFKDTSLVIIISLLELLGMAKSLVSRSEYVGTQREAFAFIAVIYFVFSYAMSSASRRLEASGSGVTRKLR